MNYPNQAAGQPWSRYYTMSHIDKRVYTTCINSWPMFNYLSMIIFLSFVAKKTLYAHATVANVCNEKTVQPQRDDENFVKEIKNHDKENFVSNCC